MLNCIVYTSVLYNSVLIYFSLNLFKLFFPQLMHKLSVEAPPKILVERYLIEIAKNYNVPYEPDAMVRVRLMNFYLCVSSD